MEGERGCVGRVFGGGCDGGGVAVGGIGGEGEGEL